MPPKSARISRPKSVHAARSRSTATRSKVTRPRRRSPPYPELSVVIPFKPGIHKLKSDKKKDREKRTDDGVGNEDDTLNRHPLRAVEIANQALDLGLEDAEGEEEAEYGNEQQGPQQAIPPPDLSLPKETRITQAREAYEAGLYTSRKAAAAAYGISHAILSRLIRGSLPIRETSHRLQKLDKLDEGSIGKEALRRVEAEDRRPTNGLIWEVANDLYRQKCTHLGIEYKPIGSQWPQRFFFRHPEFRKTWSQLVEARKPLPRAPRPEHPNGPNPWQFVHGDSSIEDDDFSKYAVPKTEEHCAAYFKQIRRGPPGTSVRIQRYLTHLLLEQGKSVDMLNRVRKALEEPEQSTEGAAEPETREQERAPEQAQGNAAPLGPGEQQPQNTATLAPTGTNISANYAAAPSQPSQPSQPSFQLPTNIPQGQEPHARQISPNAAPVASLSSEQHATPAYQPSNTSFHLPSNPISQPPELQVPQKTTGSTSIISDNSPNPIPTPFRPSITTFQQFSRDYISQPSQPPEHRESPEQQQRQTTSDATPVNNNASSGYTTNLFQSSMESFQSPAAQDASLALQALQASQTDHQDAQRHQTDADSTPTFSNASPTHNPTVFQSSLSSFPSSTNSIAQLLQHEQQQEQQEHQEAQEPEQPHAAANPLSLLNNTSPSHTPLSLSSSLSSFQLNPTHNARQSSPREVQGHPKPRKPSQPRKPQQPRPRNSLPQRPPQPLQLPHLPEPQQPAQPSESPQLLGRSSSHPGNVAPFSGWSGSLSTASSSSYHSGSFATSYGSSQPTRPQYYPNEYLFRTAMDQSSKRRRIDDPIRSINHPGYQ